MTRNEVYQIIDVERNYQNDKYPASVELSSGQMRRFRDLDVTPGILLLDAYVRKAQDAWVESASSNLKALQQVAKVAAIAVRILERAGGSEELLTKGLR